MTRLGYARFIERERRRYEYGRQAWARGLTRIGSHRAPCELESCRRPECRGFKDAAKATDR